MTLVVVESPYAGTGPWPLSMFRRWRNIAYVRTAMRDCFLNHDEVPIASHALYTQRGVLRDDVKYERRIGIEGGLRWAKHAEKTALYEDLGLGSGGVIAAIDRSTREGRPVAVRRLRGWKGWQSWLRTFEVLVLGLPGV